MIKITLNKIKIGKNLKGLIMLFCYHAFTSFLVIFLFSLIFTLLIFLDYKNFINERQTNPVSSKIRFNEESYNKLLEEIKNRSKKFQEADTKEYDNIFEAREQTEVNDSVID